jgi:hypothetical protein
MVQQNSVRQRGFRSLLCTIAGVGLTATSAFAQQRSGCDDAASAGSARFPSLSQLQSWTRAYYPSLADHAETSDRLIVGFVLDKQCRVLRHSAGLLQSDDYSEDAVLTLFPNLVRRGEPAGIADGRPRTHSNTGRVPKPRLVVAWIMQPESSLKPPISKP